jgi:endoglucanase
MQEKSGGIRGGIEADAAPPKGQTSWTTKQRLFAYAPDPWSSYLFAGAAAEASFTLRTSDAKRSATYLAAAQHAAAWAADQKVADPEGQIEGQRLVASAALYRATGDKKWHDEFLRDNPLVKGPVDQLQCPRHEVCDAAWIYLRTANHPRNDSVVANATESFRRTGDSLLTAADTSLYRFSLDDPYVPLIWGLGPSTPKTTVLIRAYVLLGDQKYWAQAARAAGYSLGANPLNTSFVTGLGTNNPKHPLVVDQRDGGLPVWPGIPVYGTQKVTEGKEGEGWFPQYFLGPAGTKPTTNDTPLLWSWYDLPVFAAHNEYTLHQSHAAALFTFGSLAALGTRKT